MDISEMLKGLKDAKSKLMATISMLLVSAILCTNATYTWFVLSTAPEVSGVSTVTGANGALEIALQSTAENGERAEITSNLGDSSALSSQPITEANKTWGNIVDVTEGYGLETITLFPSRLNVSAANNFKVNPQAYLSVPQYGSDGRIWQLTDTQKASYVAQSGTFENSGGYGVNVLGILDDMGNDGTEVIVSYFGREAVRKEATAKVANYREELRRRLIEDVIEANSAGLLELMLKLTSMNGYAQLFPWDADDENTINSIVANLTKIAQESEDALRWAVLGYAIADTEHYSPNETEEMAALGEIYKNFRTLPLTAESGLSVRGIASANGYSSIVDAVDALIIVQNQVDKANKSESSMVAGSHLVNASGTFVMNGKTPPSAEIAMAATTGLPLNLAMKVPEDYMYMVNTGEESGGLFSMMAYIVGDYQADIEAYMGQTGEIHAVQADGLTPITIWMRSTSGIGKESIDTYDPDTNVGTLQVVLDAASDRATGQIPVTTIRSDIAAYGYSIDMAFRSSEDGRLILQQEAVSRVYDGTYNPAVQGSGTTMTFEVYEEMPAERVASLLDSLYVVFTDTDSGEIYAVGIADEVTMELDTVTATLTLHKVDTDAMMLTNVIAIGEPINDNVITNLTADEEKYISAVVFLNGDTVTSADAAAKAEVSLIGSINMQFATDAPMVAMRYDDYIERPTDAVEENP